jgi:hypothetical protein
LKKNTFTHGALGSQFICAPYKILKIYTNICSTKIKQNNQAKFIKYWRLPKILAHTLNIGACSNFRRFMKIEAESQNLGAFSKFRRTFKI